MRVWCSPAHSAQTRFHAACACGRQQTYACPQTALARSPVASQGAVTCDMVVIVATRPDASDLRKRKLPCASACHRSRTFGHKYQQEARAIEGRSHTTVGSALWRRLARPAERPLSSWRARLAPVCFGSVACLSSHQAETAWSRPAPGLDVEGREDGDPGHAVMVMVMVTAAHAVGSGCCKLTG